MCELLLSRCFCAFGYYSIIDMADNSAGLLMKCTRGSLLFPYSFMASCCSPCVKCCCVAASAL